MPSVKEYWDIASYELCVALADAKTKIVNTTTLHAHLDTIVEKTKTVGKTPKNTLSKNLQILRDIGMLEYVDGKGTYRLTGTMKKFRDIKKEFRSNGERMIGYILDKMNIEHDREKTFKDLVYKGHLRIDFYFELNGRKYAIEFDGLQHFIPVAFFGGVKAFEEGKKRDAIKTEYCKKNGIKLIRISELNIAKAEKVIREAIEEC